MKSPIIHENVKFDSIVGGGQAIGQLANGKKIFAWGVLPGEVANVRQTKKKSSYVEGVAVEIITPSNERIKPKDYSSYLSTSPWQIMNFEAEQHYKAALIEEAFELHNIVLPEAIDVFSDKKIFGYRNKIEFSWYSDMVADGNDTLDLAFFKRGSKGKIVVDGTSLAHPIINQAAGQVHDILRERQVSARLLKTLLVRCNQDGKAVAQLYVRDEDFTPLDEMALDKTDLSGFELIYSNPKSPASVITKRLQQWGDKTLNDKILGVPFSYAVEGFFQINLPVYEQALKDMRGWVENSLNMAGPTSTLARSYTQPKEANHETASTAPVIDLYSGVGSIGLTIGGDDLTLVEVNEHAVREMERNIKALGKNARAVLAASEVALDFITSEATIIVDPPRAGLHEAVIKRLLEVRPRRIIYLSCNPVTQARDTAHLAQSYGIRAHRGYNFFPRTPHIEHLVVLDLIDGL